MSLIKLLLEFNKISREISDKKDDEDLARFLYEKLRKLVDFDCFTLGKFDGDFIVYNFYIEEGKIFKGLRKPIIKENSLAYLAVSQNKTIVINNFQKEINTYVQSVSVVGKAEIQYNSVLVCPLEVEGKVIGFFSVQDVKNNFFSAEKVLLFKEVGNYLSEIYSKLEYNTKVLEMEKLRPKLKDEWYSPIKNFAKDLVKKVRDTESLIIDFDDKIRRNFNIKEINFLIYKDFLNYNEYYYLNPEGILVKNQIKEKKYKNYNQEEFPLEFDSNHIGYIYVNSEDMSRINDEFEVILEFFMISLGSFIEKEMLEYENREKHQLMLALEKSYKHLSIINRIVKEINSTMDIKEMGRRVYRGICEVLNSDCSVTLAYLDNDELRYEIAVDYGKEYEISEININCETSFAAWVARNEKMLIINDYEKEAAQYIGRTTYEEEDMIGEVETNSLIYIPLYKGSNFIGVFSVQKKEKNLFDNYHIEIIKNIASFVNIALINLVEARKLSKEIEEKRRYEKRLKKINNKLEKLSSLDSLTKLYNRRHFEKLLKEFWQKSKEENSSLGFLIFDVDYFKQINDNYGHLEGDKALVEISKTLKEYVNSDVKFGRFGGDEFLGVVRNPNKEELLKMGKDIMDKVMDKKIKVPNSANGILTVTMGITLVNPNNLRNIDEMFAKADEALYIGKEKGKAQIVFL